MRYIFQQQRKMIQKKQIDLATKMIVDAVHPQRIYLFGSYANGKETEKSDIDFLVIMPDRTKKKYQLVDEIENEIRSVLPISKDIVVDYADRFNKFQSIPYSFIGHIVNTGVLLYES